MKLKYIAKEVLHEQTSNEIDVVAKSVFAELDKEFQAAEDEIQDEISQTNEAVGFLTIISIILAAPSLLEVFAKAFGKLIKAWKKLSGKENTESEKIESILHFAHKWHKLYTKALKWIFEKSGAYEKKGITTDVEKEKTAEFVFYIIVAGLAVYSGFQGIKAFQTGLQVVGKAGTYSGFSLAIFEAAMTAIKSKEVALFLKKIGIV